MKPPSVICLTPIRNEAWILERFLKCASLWADHIILADQSSTDASRQIAGRFDKVTLIENPLPDYDEFGRQKLLIEAARKIPGPRLLLALDADEFLTANFMDNPEWREVFSLAPGTVLQFRWINIRPDMKTYWSPEIDFPWGLVDDGRQHSGSRIHSPRIPMAEDSPRKTLRDIRVLHYQFADWKRMQSKHRWYQCLERLATPQRSAIDLFRQYHHMDSVAPAQIEPLPETWLAGYEQRGIDMKSVRPEQTYWWDHEVVGLIRKHGAETFRRQAIWNVDWNRLARESDPAESSNFSDPRSAWERAVHRWLEQTQLCHGSWPIRAMERVLKGFGW